MPHISQLNWNYAEQLQSTDLGGGGIVYYCYDSSGNRSRKVYEHSGVTEDRIYLGGYEIYRRRVGTTLSLERETLHVSDDTKPVLLFETKTVDIDNLDGLPQIRARWQLDNHLGSSSNELDNSAQVISYEEYHPFGSTSFHTVNGGAEVSANRYRYTGKERDDETGLYYYGARYYASWLGRWTGCDPKVEDGWNLYVYVKNAPVLYIDYDGCSSRSDIIPEKKIDKNGMAVEAKPRLTYSTKMGWVDWGHTGLHTKNNGQKMLLERFEKEITLAEGRGQQYFQFRITMGIGAENSATRSEIGEDYAVKTGLNYDQRNSTLLAMFMDISEKFEKFQDNFAFKSPVNIGPLKKVNSIGEEVRRSGFSEDDLSSNMIGFFAAVYDLSRSEVEQLVGDVGVDASLKLWDAYFQNGLGISESWEPKLYNEEFRNATGVVVKDESKPYIFSTVKLAEKGTTWDIWKDRYKTFEFTKEKIKQKNKN